MMKMPSILITNDDGIHAPGILQLYKSLKNIGKTTVVAPLIEKSAVGHAITISDPLRVIEVERNGTFFGYAVNGTPADCVKLGVQCILENKPDVVVSGINLGPNTATNIIYSGTVSAAAEAIIMGFPAMAVSLTSFTSKDFTYAGKIANQLTKQILKHGLPDETLLNVNVPAVPEKDVNDIIVTRQGRARYQEAFDKRIDPNNRTYYWLTGKKMLLDQDSDVDDLAVMHNNVSITPIHYDLTDYKFLQELKKWNLKP